MTAQEQEAFNHLQSEYDRVIEWLPFNIDKMTISEQSKLEAFVKNQDRFTEAQFDKLMSLTVSQLNSIK